MTYKVQSYLYETLTDGSGYLQPAGSGEDYTDPLAALEALERAKEDDSLWVSHDIVGASWEYDDGTGEHPHEGVTVTFPDGTVCRRDAWQDFELPPPTWKLVRRATEVA